MTDAQLACLVQSAEERHAWLDALALRLRLCGVDYRSAEFGRDAKNVGFWAVLVQKPTGLFTVRVPLPAGVGALDEGVAELVAAWVIPSRRSVPSVHERRSIPTS